MAFLPENANTAFKKERKFISFNCIQLQNEFVLFLCMKTRVLCVFSYAKSTSLTMQTAKKKEKALEVLTATKFRPM